MDNNYDSSIITVGGIPDYYFIYKALELAGSNSDIVEALIANDEFGIRTEESRKRYLAVVKSVFLNFASLEHEALINSIFKEENDCYDTKLLILFWQFSINNRLFYELNQEIFLKQYFAGYTVLKKGEVKEYIEQVIIKNKAPEDRWSESTIDKTASKYLTVLKKFQLITGVQKKCFKNIYLSNSSLVLFVYLILSRKPESSNFLENNFLSFSFLSKEAFLERVKPLAQQGFFEMSYNGVSLLLKPKYSFKEIFNVLCNRVSKKV